ncbi:MAG: DNA polymerase I [Desulfuromonadales bacterium]|nr:DNA polymerase I [Desulfuromonadales bacterium]
MSDQCKRLYLIDGSSYIYRAYYAIRHLSNGKGFPTNAIYGFTTMLLKIVRDEQPDYLAVVFDPRGPTFRKELYPAYKANRISMPDDLIPQIPKIKEVVAALNLPVLEEAGFEADDLIATLAKRFASDELKVTIVTGDKDLMQTVTPQVRLLDTMKEKFTGMAEVAERFGGPPSIVIEVQALAGDSSDNVPGVPGIGEKTAVKLIQEFKTVENLLANTDKLKGKQRENLETFAQQARLSRQLVTLIDDLPIAYDLESLAPREPNRPALTALFKELEFHKLLNTFSSAESSDSSNYRGVLTLADLDELVQELNAAPAFAFDTETTGLDPLRADLVGLSFATQAKSGWYIPLRHHYLGMPVQLDVAVVLERLRPLLTDPQRLKVAQNGKFDTLVLRRAGITVAGLDFDTMLASYLTNPTSKSHGMDALAAELLDYKTITYDEMTGTGKKRVCFSEVEIEKAIVYAAEDADVTWRLYEFLAPLLVESGQEYLFHQVEMPLSVILAEMEWNGIRVDAELLAGLSREIEIKLARLETEIHELAGTPFNIASPKQLGEILFEKLQLPKGKKTKSGWSTDVDVLNDLAAEHIIASRLLDYRSLAKLKGTYTDALPKLIHPETGRIHTSFNQAITVTGRLSSSDPNLQNIPIRSEEGARIREAFIPAQGNLLLCADYSQIELRVLAHLADEPALKESFLHDEDIHRRTASEIFGIFPELVTSEQRRQAKTINFAVLYGMGAFSLAKDLNVDRKTAQHFIDSYFARYSRVKDFIAAKQAEARELLYVTTILGRRCAVPDIHSSNGGIRAYAERNAVNYPVQGSAADIIKVAMLNVFGRMKKEGLRSKLLLQVHDELVFDVPLAEVEIIQKLVKEEMEGAMALSVPLTVAVGVGKNWREAH